MKHIRNFSIIAHIDHGKSTLADRFIQICGGLAEREMEQQVLDSNPIERERGITIKAQCVSLPFRARDGEVYSLNFIDTPGHVDFSYEVSRSLAACEGALLVVDAAQGVEAQSVANCYTAVEQGLEVVPVLNKIDLPTADPEKVKKEIEAVIGIDASDALEVSAKTGLNVREVLEAIVTRIPPPRAGACAELQALIIDSWFDNYLGVVSLVRVMQGEIKPRDRITVMSTGRSHEVDQVGIFTPKRKRLERLGPGEVGFVCAAIKEVNGAPVGDTLTHTDRPAAKALPGFQKIQPRVFAGLFPSQADDYPAMREALDKLTLNDSSLYFEPESSGALGFGFRCGFLGMLHMEIVQERLEREYDIDLITTAPTVVYQVLKTDGSVLDGISRFVSMKEDELREATRDKKNVAGIAEARKMLKTFLSTRWPTQDVEVAIKKGTLATVPDCAFPDRTALGSCSIRRGREGLRVFIVANHYAAGDVIDSDRALKMCLRFGGAWQGVAKRPGKREALPPQAAAVP